MTPQLSAAANDNDIDDTGPASLNHVAHHEAGHAIMHLMYGHYIKSASIKEANDRYGKVKAFGPRCSQEADLLCKLAGPVAEMFYIDGDSISEATFSSLHDKAVMEDVFDDPSRRKVSVRKYLDNLELCIEVVGHPDFRSAVNLLAGRLMEHRYLAHKRLVRLSDDKLWNIYNTSRERIAEAKGNRTKIIPKMMMEGLVLERLAA